MRLLVVGNDRISRMFARNSALPADVGLVTDYSTNVLRVLRLLRRGTLTPGIVARMMWAEFLRPDPGPVEGLKIRSSAELTMLVREREPSEILLFRAGVIIKRELIDLGIPIYNLHAARLPDYGGLGTIFRALADGAFEQTATLHRVTESIDAGEVLETEPYRLDPRLSYRANEAIAYAAGIRLLERTLDKDKA